MLRHYQLRICAGLILLNFPLEAEDIYQYQNSSGTMVYTNKPIKNGKKVNLPPLSIYSAPMTRSDLTAPGYTLPLQSGSVGLSSSHAASYGTFNETGRRQILTEELSKEKVALSDAKSALANAKNIKLSSEANNPSRYQQRLQTLEDAITEHQKNIAILSQQLGVAY